jgi:predicted phage terminase large subunit-like protein
MTAALPAVAPEAAETAWFWPWFESLSPLAQEDLLAEATREAAAIEQVASVYLPLREYIRQAWHVVEPRRPYTSGWHIEAISEHLEAVSRGQIQRLIINIPPRHMKSLSVCVFWPTWEWTFAPWTRWLFSSYNGDFSIRDSLRCRRIIQSAWYQERWSHVYQLAGDQNVKSRFENDKTGYRIATSVGGVGTGEGGDRIVVDDPLKAEDAYSDAAREAANRWWTNTMATRGNDPDLSAWVVICQRLHVQDLPGYLLDQMKQGGEQYELLILPAEYEPKVYVTSVGWRDPRQEPGQLLWPERYPGPRLASFRTQLGPQAYSAQFQQHPTEAEGAIFKKAYWRFWRPAGSDLPPVRMELETGEVMMLAVFDAPECYEAVIQSWDMTFKNKQTSAYVAGQVWARHRGNRYLLDQWRGHAGIVKTLEAVRELSAQWPEAAAKLVEEAANGPAVMELLQEEIPGLLGYQPDGDKVARAHAVVPIVESGNVYLPHPVIAPWVYGYIDELAKFPLSAYADQVDATTQALRYLLTGRRKKTATSAATVTTAEELFGE